MMPIQTKAIITVLGIALLFVVPRLVRYNNRKLKERFEARNSDTPQKFPWFFSEQKNTIMTFVFWLGIIVYVVMAWLDMVGPVVEEV